MTYYLQSAHRKCLYFQKHHQRIATASSFSHAQAPSQPILPLPSLRFRKNAILSKFSHWLNKLRTQLPGPLCSRISKAEFPPCLTAAPSPLPHSQHSCHFSSVRSREGNNCGQHPENREQGSLAIPAPVYLSQLSLQASRRHWMPDSNV